MTKLVYKKNDVYDGKDSYTNVMYTEDELVKLKEEVYDYEKQLSKKYKPYDSEYSYELGLYLSEKLKEYAVIESDRYKFWDMLREYVNEKDNRKVFQSKQREPYEYCYKLSKLDRNLVLKYPRSRWDHLFDCITAREDERLYKWLLNNKNEEFNSSSDCWKEFVKGLKVYFKKIDTTIFSEIDLFNKYEDIMCKSIFVINYMKKYGKLSSAERDKYFELSKGIFCNKNIEKMNLILHELKKTHSEY